MSDEKTEPAGTVTPAPVPAGVDRGELRRLVAEEVSGRLTCPGCKAEAMIGGRCLNCGSTLDADGTLHPPAATAKPRRGIDWLIPGGDE